MTDGTLDPAFFAPTATTPPTQWPNESGVDSHTDAPPSVPPGDQEPAPSSESIEPPAATRAVWELPALVATLLASGLLYLWNLGESGWANGFYSAAAQAGSASWKAWLFGASDAAASITVDKPPAALWIPGLSVRLFGLSSWSILVPQALMGVGTVFLVWLAVRRWFGAGPAIFAALVMATTPVAALMFRFNNPDALLTLLMTAAAYTTLRGIEDGRRRWAIATGALIGFGFLTKQLQVLLIVPPLTLAYLIAAPGRAARRIADLSLAGAAMLVSAGWWVALVEFWPASSRPYIGGSQNNSFLELTFGYNGFGRLSGDEVGSVGGGGGPGGSGRWGQTGITRLFDGAIGGQITWLVPAALIAIAAALWLTRRAPRTDLVRAATIVWGGWLLVTGLVFSYMAGIFHEYYTVALAPSVAVPVGIGAALWWRHRHTLAARIVGALTLAVTTWWAFELLDRAPDWNPWLAPTVVVAGTLAAGLMFSGGMGRSRWVAMGTGALAGVVCLAGPTAWALETAATPHTGAIVTAGPSVQGAQFGGGPGGFRPGLGGPGGQADGTGPGRGPLNGSGAPQGRFPGSFGGLPAPGGRGGAVGNSGTAPAGPGGGLLDATEPGAELTAALLEAADAYTWIAATVGANNAAGYQLATERSVMPIGGFNGSDPSPTLAEFQELVAEGAIHYFIGGRGIGPSAGGSQEASAITDWVTTTFDPITVDGTVLYDLSQGIL